MNLIIPVSRIILNGLLIPRGMTGIGGTMKRKTIPRRRIEMHGWKMEIWLLRPEKRVGVGGVMEKQSNIPLRVLYQREKEIGPMESLR
jgi:hypothetical protein